MINPKKKPRKKRENLEEKEQMALIEWAHLHDDIWPYLIHIRNEGKRSLAEGAKAKKMGLMKGVSDLFLASPKILYNYEGMGKINCIFKAAGMWIELKAGKGKVSPAQKSFQQKMREAGYEARIYYCWTDAAKAICEYLGKETSGL